MHKSILVCLAFLMFSYPLSVAAGDRRSEALQLYQEGLFQETGTGDLKMAIHIYSQIAKSYPEYRDLKAVALYHLGLVYEKLGNPEQARQAYQTIVHSYPDQTKLANQAQLKLEYLSKNNEVELVTQPLDEVEESNPDSVPADPLGLQPEPIETPVASPRPFPSQVGVGLDWFGLHASYRTSNRLQLELQVQTRNNEYTLGTRTAFYSELFSTALPFSLYTGVDYRWVLNPSTRAKYYVGGFIGTEFLWQQWIGLGADVGYYYVNEKQSTQTDISTSVLSQVHITLYF